MARLGEEIPPLGEHARVLHEEGRAERLRGGWTKQEQRRQREGEQQEGPAHGPHHFARTAVEELAGVEGAAHGPLAQLPDGSGLYADRAVQRGFWPQPAITRERCKAAEVGKEARDERRGHEGSCKLRL